MMRNQQGTLRDFFKQWPAFYYLVALVFGPLFFCGLSGKAFLKKYPRVGTSLNLGSGPRRLGACVKSVDIQAFQNVDVVASMDSLPFENASVARIVCDNVIEHIRVPAVAVNEIHRILETGGVAYISTPFLYPLHGSPGDFTRWTEQGLRGLFEEFEFVELGMRAGPFSALTAYLCYLFATIFSFGSNRLYELLVNLSMFLFVPIKLLDIVFNYWPQSIRMAAALYCVVRKR